MSEKETKSKSLVTVIIAVVILLFGVLGVSYAAFYYSKTGNSINNVSTGSIMMSYNENNNGIYLSDAYPLSDSVGRRLFDTNQYFDFTVSATMSGNTIIDYVIVGSKDGENSTLPDDGVKLYLTSLENGKEIEMLSPTKISSLKSTDSISYAPNGQYLILQTNFTKTTSRNYRLRMWVADDYILPDFSLTYAFRINVYGSSLT